MSALSALRFDNRFVRELPADPVLPSRHGKTARRQVHGAAYSRVVPRVPAAPELLACSREVAELLGLGPDACADPALPRVFGGAELLEGMEPYAMAYGGHQFGHWAGQLGDGRAINLGQVVGTDDRLWTLQLKGAGLTPYSRTADGLAVLRSSVREFLCSEAMHHLGVPTTRALSLVATGERVPRDMFYDGNVREEPGAVVCRVARSFTRLGSFELPASRGDTDLLRQLADHTVRVEFPHLELTPERRAGSAPLVPDDYVRWCTEVVRATAETVAHWMRVGFVHGVLNTDNLSIVGDTLDYGPYGWLEGYDPGWTPNTTDAESRRYVFGNQPAVAHWNLTRFASAIVPLVGEVAPLQAAVDAFPDVHGEYARAMTAAKLGLTAWEPGDDALADELFAVLQLVETDMTWFFRELGRVPVADDAREAELLAPFRAAAYVPGEATEETRARALAWARSWAARARRDGADDDARRARMDAANPRFVLRNYLAQQAIEAAEEGDASGIRELLDVLRRPYEEQPGREAFAAKRPEWARHRPGCSTLSCSS